MAQVVGGFSYTTAYTSNNPINLVDPYGLWSWQGAGRGVRNVAVGTVVGVAVVAFLPETAVGVVAVAGSAALGLTAGQAITGISLDGKVICDEKRSEMIVESVFGVGALGTAAAQTKAFLPYYKYTRTGPQKIFTDGEVNNGTWLTRGTSEPYSNDWKLAKDKLQLPKVPNKVTEVKVPFWKYVAGPRKTIKHPEWGSGKDDEWRVGGWYGE